MDMDMDMDIIYPVNMGRFVSQGGLTNGLRRLLNACFSFASKTRVAQDLAKGHDSHKKFLKSHFLTIALSLLLQLKCAM